MISLIRVTPRRDAAHRPEDGWIAVKVGDAEPRSAIGGTPDAALANFIAAHGLDGCREIRVGWTHNADPSALLLSRAEAGDAEDEALRDELSSALALLERGEGGTTPKPDACPKCGHAAHGATCFNFASDHDCSCTYVAERGEGGPGMSVIPCPDQCQQGQDTWGLPCEKCGGSGQVDACPICGKIDHNSATCPHASAQWRALKGQPERPTPEAGRLAQRETCLTALRELEAECESAAPSPVTLRELASTVARATPQEWVTLAGPVVRLTSVVAAIIDAADDISLRATAWSVREALSAACVALRVQLEAQPESLVSDLLAAGLPGGEGNAP